MYQRFIRFPELIHITGRSRASIYRDMENGDFPKSTKIGPRSIGWTEESVRKWMKEQVQRSAAA